MKTQPRFLLMGVLAAMLSAFACFTLDSQAAQPRAHSAQLEESSSARSRLVVQINNVADENSSRRNRVDLFVNGKKIEPSNMGARVQRDQVYELALPSGVHKIHAVYHAQSFWKEMEYKITTHDGSVRLYPDYTTFLSIALEKKSDGTLARNKNLFTEIPRLTNPPATTPEITPGQFSPAKIVEPVRAITTQTLADKEESEKVDSVTEARPIMIAPVAPRVRASAQASEPKPELEPARSVIVPENSENAIPVVNLDRNVAPNEPLKASVISAGVAPAPVVSSHVESAARIAGKIALQINTTPTNAEVIVDDRFVGQSPLIAHVERDRSHVIQISKKGYAEKIKLLDRSELGNQQTYFLIEKLEKLEE